MRALAIDLGGTNIRAGLSGEDALAARPLGQWPAPASLDELRQRVASLLAENGAARMGVCIPGLARGTVCAWVPNLPFLDSVDLAALFPDVQVALGNDAQFALLAEAAGGAARDVDNAILLAIGTGIGSAVLADGRILRGAGGAATSFGWACADPEDQGSDVHGWLERIASGTAFDRVAVGLDYADGRALMAAVRDGNEEATRAIEPAAAALGTTLAGAVALTGAARVIFAGGVVESLDVLGPRLRPTLIRQLPPHLRDVEIAAGEFGTRAGLVGAGLAAHGHPIWAEDRP